MPRESLPQSSVLARDMGTSSPSHPTPRFPHLGRRGHAGEDVPALPPGCPSSKGPQAGNHRPPPPFPYSPTPFLLLSRLLAPPPPRQPHCGPLSPAITQPSHHPSAGAILCDAGPIPAPGPLRLLGVTSLPLPAIPDPSGCTLRPSTQGQDPPRGFHPTCSGGYRRTRLARAVAWAALPRA